MRIRTDEDLPRACAQMLRDRGHDAVSVVDQSMGGWKDPELWHTVQHERRYLITGDKGFADVRTYPPGTHAGVLPLRPDRDGIRPTVRLLEQVLAGYDVGALVGATAVVTPRGVRIRRTGA